MNWRLNFIFLDGLGARTRSSPEGGGERLRAPVGDRRGLPAPGCTPFARYGAGPGCAPHLVPGATTRPRPTPWPAVLPGAGRPCKADSWGAKQRSPQTCSPAGQRYPVGRAEQSEERSLLDFLPPPPRLSRQEKFSRQGQACPPRPENARVPRLRDRACGAGSEERAEEGTGPGGAVPHNLAPGHPGPPPQHRPRVPAGAPSCRGYCGGRLGCTLRAGALRSKTFLRVCVRSPASPGPRRPYLPPRGPGLHAEGAGGGRRREEASRARRRGPSPERSPLQLQPWSTPSFPPRERGDGGGNRERKSRFPSATRRSSTARHEPEETAAAARRPMGQ